jgi:signal transduction histidine kinase
MTDDLAEMVRLYERATSIASSADLFSWLEGLLSTVVAMMGAALGDVQLLDPKSGLSIVARAGGPAEALALLRGGNDEASLAFRAVSARRRIVVEDIAADPHFGPRLSIARQAGFTSVDVIPLMSQSGAPIGAISTYFARPVPHDESLLRRTEAFATAAACTVERRRRDEEREAADVAVGTRRGEIGRAMKRRLLGELLVGIAHELNQPLGAIVNNGNALLRQIERKGEGCADLIDVLSDMIEAAKRASGLVANVRALTRPPPLVHGAVRMNTVVTDAVAFLRRDIEQRRVDIRLELDCDLPFVSGDRIQLIVLLVQLVMNAYEATTEGSEHVPLVVIAGRKSMFDDRPGVTILVQDLGQGFDPKNCETVFQPFHTTKSTNIGMGLAVSRAIVEAHGGRIWATSVPGRGSTFQCLLPAIVAHA